MSGMSSPTRCSSWTSAPASPTAPVRTVTTRTSASSTCRACGFRLDEGIETAKPEHFDDWRQGSLGAILEQDFSNMSEVTVGLHSRGYDGHRLNRAQEMTIWNYHRAMDEFLFGP